MQNFWAPPLKVLIQQNPPDMQFFKIKLPGDPEVGRVPDHNVRNFAPEADFGNRP